MLTRITLYALYFLLGLIKRFENVWLTEFLRSSCSPKTKIRDWIGTTDFIEPLSPLVHFISIQINRRASIIQKLMSLNALPYIRVHGLVIIRAMNEIKSAIIGKLLQSVDVSC